MKMKKMLVPTLRDVPADAESMGHKLLVRAGYIRKTNSGLFSYLPLGAKVLENIEKLIKDALEDEMFQGIILPTINTVDTLESTGSDMEYGSELFKFRDRNSISNMLLPSYEEAVTEAVKADLKSYKQLPLRLYTMTSRFKDEERPRLGLTRTREYLSCDVICLDKDDESAKSGSELIQKIFESIFEKLNLKPVKAVSHPGLNGTSAFKFIAPVEGGEETLWYADDNKYAATEEVASVHLEYGEEALEMEELKWMETPGCITIDDVSEYLKVPGSHCAKALDLMVRNKPVLVMIPGDRELSLPKLTKYLGVTEKDIVMMMDYEIIELFGSKPGFTGPKGIKPGVRIILDERVTKMKNLVIGTNEVNSHYINANFGRDFDGEIAEDLVEIREGDVYPDTNERLKSLKGTSIAKFKDTSDNYSKALKATFLNENGKEQYPVIGSYSLGISRIMNVIADLNNDEKGIIWPVSIAPYKAIITTVNTKVEEQNALANKIYEELKSKGIEVLLDDRDERAGVKFNDRDLIGIPYRITVGKGAPEEIVEFSERHEMVNYNMSAAEAIDKILNR